MDFRDLAPDYEEQHLTWFGIIAEDATSVDQLLLVILPDWDDTLQWGPCMWQFKDDQNLPKRGDNCLVIFDNNRTPWITSWWQEADYIPPVGGGSGVNTGHWQWDTSTATAATRHVGINTAAWNTATIVNLSETDTNGSDMANYFAVIQPGDILYLQPTADSSRWGRYTVNAAPVDHGTYQSISVTYKDGAGSLPGNNNDMNVSLSQPGTPGPPGPPGPPAPTFVYTQGSPSASWIVVHNLGQFPSVTVIDTGDSVVIPSVHYDSSNQVTITFGSATSGKAYLN